MRDEDELVPLSALQHYLYCPRQCALIHVEQLWSENRSTAEGRLFHDRVHESGTELRDAVLTVRGLRLASRQLGLAGIADVVEFHRLEDGAPGGASLPNRPGAWQPFPVEYKRGRMKRSRADEVQLCAQALCLEEMLSVEVPEGALFYGKARRRRPVVFDPELRHEVAQTAKSVQKLFDAGVTPAAVVDRKCRDCSLREDCNPPESAGGASAYDYLQRELGAILSETEG